MSESASRTLQAVVDDHTLGAVDKLRAYFDASTTWKAENLTAVTTTIRMWRHENNALLRQKMSQESMRTTAPLLESIIRQGCDEGVFDTSHPSAAAVIVTGMGLNLADAIIDAMDADGTVGLDTGGARTSELLAAYVEAFERILGARPGSLAP
jgi:hypothetical protein